jgi:hypothetical protein
MLQIFADALLIALGRRLPSPPVAPQHRRRWEDLNQTRF